MDYRGLRLLCCDSSVPGRHDGELGAAQLAWLDRAVDRVMLTDADEPPGLLLHRLEGGAAMTHLVPISHSGPPIGAL